jgi:hypothetical protein
LDIAPPCLVPDQARCAMDEEFMAAFTEALGAESGG